LAVSNQGLSHSRRLEVDEEWSELVANLNGKAAFFGNIPAEPHIGQGSIPKDESKKKSCELNREKKKGKERRSCTVGSREWQEGRSRRH